MQIINKFFVCFVLLITQSICAQNFILEYQIGSFTSAYSFCINPAGYLYVTDVSSNEIIKLDTLGNILKTIGGYGWEASSFDFPLDVYANTLNVYIADKYNDRIQIFDKDLNYISSIAANSIENENYKFRYPTAVGVSAQGDIFILDSDNSRILKFNSSGNFLMQIGYYNSGDFALQNPKVFTIKDDKIFVIDSSHLLLYDLFGNNFYKTKLDYEPININSTSFAITINSSIIIYYSLIKNNVNTFEFTFFEPKIDDIIVDSLIFNSKLYILTSKNIYVYKIIAE